MSLLPFGHVDPHTYVRVLTLVLALAVFMATIVLFCWALFGTVVARVLLRVRYGVWTPPFCSACGAPRGTVTDGEQSAGARSSSVVEGSR